MTDFLYKILYRDQRARVGKIYTAHGTIDTPAFMPVGTAATVKCMFPEDIKKTGAQIILSNTYHLMLRPGAERIARLGGLHKFMNWSGPILTDSGGYQVMSLGNLCTISEESVIFRNHINGSKVILTPEISIQIQHMLGSTITMVFDECIGYPISEQQAIHSMQRSIRWAKRSQNIFVKRDGYALYGIQHGSIFAPLRYESSQKLIELDFSGYAVGGLAVGEGSKIMFDTLDFCVDMLPISKPRYLMGVGKPTDLVHAVMCGIDQFDCVLPTRSGRNAQAFTHYGTLNLHNAYHRDSNVALDNKCECITCSKYSRAYLHHLTKTHEILGAMLLTLHNLTYYQKLMNDIRTAIKNSCMTKFAYRFFTDQENGDPIKKDVSR